jgi:hypothetical protein
MMALAGSFSSSMRETTMSTIPGANMPSRAALLNDCAASRVRPAFRWVRPTWIASIVSTKTASPEPSEINSRAKASYTLITSLAAKWVSFTLSEKHFFFEKKKQKTFESWSALCWKRRNSIIKSFLVLFFKKELMSLFVSYAVECRVRKYV